MRLFYAIAVAFVGGAGAAGFSASAHANGTEGLCFDKDTLTYIACPAAPAPVPAPAPAAPPPPPPPTVFAPLWGGCYVGVHAGGQESEVETRSVDGTSFTNFTDRREPEGATGGAQVGCLLPVAGGLVVGFELDGSAVDGSSSGSGVADPAASSRARS